MYKIMLWILLIFLGCIPAHKFNNITQLGNKFENFAGSYIKDDAFFINAFELGELQIIFHFNRLITFSADSIEIVGEIRDATTDDKISGDFIIGEVTEISSEIIKYTPKIKIRSDNGLISIRTNYQENEIIILKEIGWRVTYYNLIYIQDN
jgi:hypothetical protein